MFRIITLTTLAFIVFTSFIFIQTNHSHQNCAHHHNAFDIANYELPTDLIQKIEKDSKIKTIVIDAGHGGKDSGCRGAVAKVKEKVITLKIALKLGKYIEDAFPDLNVVYTRKTDTFIPLHERAHIANKNKADLFISIHCNAVPKLDTRGKTVNGTETYVMGLHTAEENLDVAKRENEAILLEDDYKKNYDGFDPNSPEGHIMLSMVQDAHLEQSINFASKIDNQFRYKAKRNSRGVRQAGFVVLRQTTMPSVLIEAGFLTNKYEEKFLNTDYGQNLIASAIYRAFKEYKTEIEPIDTKASTAKGSAKPTPAEYTTTTKITKTEEIKVNYMKPIKGIVYKVQFAAANKPFPIDKGKWTTVGKIEVSKEGKMYKYLSDNHYSYANCTKALKTIKAKGFPDAFIVAYQDGKKISVADAKKIAGK